MSVITQLVCDGCGKSAGEGRGKVEVPNLYQVWVEEGEQVLEAHSLACLRRSISRLLRESGEAGEEDQEDSETPTE